MRLTNFQALASCGVLLCFWITSAHAVVIYDDSANGTISTINSNGSVNTYASNVSPNTLEGMTFDASGNLYVVDSAGSITKFSSTGVKTSNFASTLSAARQMTFYNGNLYVLGDGDEIDKVTLAGVVSPFAVLTTSLTAGGFGLAVDNNGNLYANVVDDAAQTQTETIYKVSPSGSVSPYKTWTDVNGDSPGPLVTDSHGNLFTILPGGVTSTPNITEIDAMGNVSTFVTPNMSPNAITIDGNDNLYAYPLDNGSNISEITPEGGISDMTATSFQTPQFLAVQLPEPSLLASCGIAMLMILSRRSPVNSDRAK